MAAWSPWRSPQNGLLLRPWRPDDADAVHRACQDPDIQRWTTVPRPYLREHADAFVAQVRRRRPGRPAPERRSRSATRPPASCSARAASSASTAPTAPARSATGRRPGPAAAAWPRSPPARSPGGRSTDLGVRPARLARRARQPRLPARRAAGRLPDRGASPGDGDRRRAADAWVGAMLPGDDRPERAGPVYVRRRADGVRPPAARRCSPRPGAGEIRLRPLEERDIDGVVAGGRDPESVRWTTVPHPYEREHAEFFVHEYGPRVVGARHRRRLRRSATRPPTRTPESWSCGCGEPTRRVADVGFVVPPRARGPRLRAGRARRRGRVGVHRARPDPDRVAGQRRQQRLPPGGGEGRLHVRGHRPGRARPPRGAGRRLGGRAAGDRHRERDDT